MERIYKQVQSMDKHINYKIWTVCMIKNKNQVLMLDRKHDSFSGFIPPGGKVEFPESFTEAAIREVFEETGLIVRNLTYKGLYEYVNVEKNERYMIFHYITSDFEGSLNANNREGNPVWISIDQLDKIPMQPSIRRRIPLFFEEGTFEIQVEWDNVMNIEGKVTIKKT
jgi:8-oxo-dGTP diphosphatase